MSGCRTSVSPTGIPSPVTTCRTPGGMTSCASSAKRRMVSGVCSAGLLIRGFATLGRREPSQLRGVLVDDAGELQQELHAVFRSLVPPLAPGLLGRVDGALDVLGRTARDFGGHLPGCRIRD